MRSAFSLLLILLTVQMVSAQDDTPDNPLFPKPRPKRFFIGPMVGYNSNFHSGGFQTLGGPGLDVACGDFSKGGGNGILAGLAAEYWFKPGGPTALQMRVYYEQKPGTFDQTGSLASLVDPTDGSVHNFFVVHHVEAKYNLVNIEVQYKYNFPGTRFGVAIGPKFGFMISSDYHQYQQLTPDKVGEVFHFQNGTDKIDLVPAAGLIPGASTIRFGLVAHIQYEFLLGPFLVTPRILWDQAVTKIVSGWSVSSLAGTIEIKYGF